MFVSITRAPIDPAAVLSRVGGPEDGAAVVFVGTIRNHNEGRAVAGLSYDAYVEMAERVLGDIAREAVSRLGPRADGREPVDDASGDRIAVTHRIGALDVGEPGVAVAVASAHRAEAFEACRYVIDELKRRAPIWKRERYVEGTAEWLGGTVPSTTEGRHE